MQRLEVSGAVRLIYKSLGVKGLNPGLLLSNQICHDHQVFYSKLPVQKRNPDL